jgi:thiol-disulfide isomerase/thioredoxin
MGYPAAMVGEQKRRVVIDPRVILAGAGAALVGVAVLVLFLWMVPDAAAREREAACKGLKGEPVLNPALCPPNTVCSAPIPAPDFTATDINGKPVKLSDFRGKVVLVNFWASWCGVCKTEKPGLNAMAADMASGDFVVIALASDHTWTDALAGVIEALGPPLSFEGRSRDEAFALVKTEFGKLFPHGAPFKVLLDPPPGEGNIGAIASAWGITAVPESALIDRKGNLRAYFGNKRDWQSGVAETCLRSVIEE